MNQFSENLSNKNPVSPISVGLNQSNSATRVALIQAMWHHDIVDQCRVGFEERWQERGHNSDLIDLFQVPGSFDIPLLAKRLANTGDYAAVVATGLVVDGGIYRHDFVASTVVDALMQVQLTTDVPVLSAVLTPHHFQEHEQHLTFFHDHFRIKGHEAAHACLMIMGNFSQLAEQVAQ